MDCYFKIKVFIFSILMFCTGFSMPAGAQAKAKVTIISGLSFGNFYPSSAGGWIEVDASGMVNSSGVIHLGGYTSAAEFSIRTFGYRRIIYYSVLASEVQLTRAGGGGNMTLHLGPLLPDHDEHPSGNYTRSVRLGGRLSVGSISANPPGNYSGTFQILINNN